MIKKEALVLSFKESPHPAQIQQAEKLLIHSIKVDGVIFHLG